MLPTRINTVLLAAIEATELTSFAISIFRTHIPTAITQPFFTQPRFGTLAWFCVCFLVNLWCIHTHLLAATEATFLISRTVKVHSTFITHFVTETRKPLPRRRTSSFLSIHLSICWKIGKHIHIIPNGWVYAGSMRYCTVLYISLSCKGRILPTDVGGYYGLRTFLIYRCLITRGKTEIGAYCIFKFIWYILNSCTIFR